LTFNHSVVNIPNRPSGRLTACRHMTIAPTLGNSGNTAPAKQNFTW